MYSFRDFIVLLTRIWQLILDKLAALQFAFFGGNPYQHVQAGGDGRYDSNNIDDQDTRGGAGSVITATDSKSNAAALSFSDRFASLDAALRPGALRKRLDNLRSGFGGSSSFEEGPMTFLDKLETEQAGTAEHFVSYLSRMEDENGSISELLVAMKDLREQLPFQASGRLFKILSTEESARELVHIFLQMQPEFEQVEGVPLAETQDLAVTAEPQSASQDKIAATSSSAEDPSLKRTEEMEAETSATRTEVQSTASPRISNPTNAIKLFGNEYAAIISSAIVSGPSDLRKVIIKDLALVEELFTFLVKTKKVSSEAHRTHVAQVLTSLIKEDPTAIIRILKSKPDIMPALLASLDCSSVLEVLTQLVNNVCIADFGMVQWDQGYSVECFSYLYHLRVYEYLATVFGSASLALNDTDELRMEHCTLLFASIVSVAVKQYKRHTKERFMWYLNIFENSTAIGTLLQHALCSYQSQRGKKGSALFFALKLCIHCLTCAHIERNQSHHTDRGSTSGFSGISMAPFENEILKVFPQLLDVLSEGCEAVQPKHSRRKSRSRKSSKTERHHGLVNATREDNESEFSELTSDPADLLSAGIEGHTKPDNQRVSENSGLDTTGLVALVPRPSLGKTKLAIVELIVACVKTCTSKSVEHLLQSNLASILMALASLHDRSSILHFLIELAVELSLLGPHHKLGIRTWLHDYNLVHKILQVWNARKHDWQETRTDLTYLSFVIHLACCVQECMDRCKAKDPGLYEALRSYLGTEKFEEFDRFCRIDLAEILKTESKVLGGERPTRSLFESLAIMDFAMDTAEEDDKAKAVEEESNPGKAVELGSEKHLPAKVSSAHRFNAPAMPRPGRLGFGLPAMAGSGFHSTSGAGSSSLVMGAPAAAAADRSLQKLFMQ